MMIMMMTDMMIMMEHSWGQGRCTLSSGRADDYDDDAYDDDDDYDDDDLVMMIIMIMVMIFMTIMMMTTMMMTTMMIMMMVMNTMATIIMMEHSWAGVPAHSPVLIMSIMMDKMIIILITLLS